MSINRSGPKEKVKALHDARKRVKVAEIVVSDNDNGRVQFGPVSINGRTAANISPSLEQMLRNPIKKVSPLSIGNYSNRN